VCHVQKDTGQLTIAIQNRLAANASLSTDIRELFRDALGNADSRWLRKRGSLRNLLAHYLLDSKAAVRFPSDATRVDAIECLGGGLTFDEICIAQNALQGHDRPWRQGNESDALINDDERGLHADCED
jgi:hypothetical protein